ncbi:hypothetical protein [Microbulbifer magnicolonia]|uniref:hypothetical protein n=1 Tax=Microbulbifer magnicolonia TaxID=3109744 RepID=UPI002B4145B5|nr:hypothetical protein [Microbulbifer sp. GG15]
MKKNLLYLIAIAAVFFLYNFVVSYGWELVTPHDVFRPWVKSTFPPESSPFTYNAINLAYIFILSVIFALPAGIALRWLLPASSWKLIIPAVLIFFFIEYRASIIDGHQFIDYASNPRTFVYMIFALAMYPIAYLLAARVPGLGRNA